ncbi:MAG: hypothetical protein HY815_04510 [Candidatus Riflebacteria bacterium]|nr:hypothetical protein [Candidatus Riflebacteria bacterium]
MNRRAAQGLLLLAMPCIAFVLVSCAQDCGFDPSTDPAGWSRSVIGSTSTPVHAGVPDGQ